jgi:glycosyltransferase involved in cell wall biosynthesis
MTAYRQSETVEQAIRSALAQIVDFPFEVIVGVDASEDSTAAEVERVVRESEGRARALLHPVRVGIFRNFAAVYGAARGDVVALLEGDDYWTDPSKLQRQVDLLNNEPNVSVCGHVTRIERSGVCCGLIPDRTYPERSRGVDFLARGCDFHLSSLVFRDRFERRLPRALTDERTRAFDLALKVLLANGSDVGFIDRQMSVFRARDGSLSSSFETDRAGWLRAMVLSLVLCRPHLGRAERREADRFTARILFALAKARGLRPHERWTAALRGALASPGTARAALSGLAYRSVPESARAAVRRLRSSVGGRTRDPQRKA